MASRQENQRKLMEIRRNMAIKKAENKELSEIEKFVDFAYHYGYAECMINNMYALHDKYGFGHDRLLFLINYLEDFHGEYGRKGVVTIDDKAQVLKDECKLNLDTVEMEVIGQKYWTRGTAVNIAESSTKRTGRKK